MSKNRHARRSKDRFPVILSQVPNDIDDPTKSPYVDMDWVARDIEYTSLYTGITRTIHPVSNHPDQECICYWEAGGGTAISEYITPDDHLSWTRILLQWATDDLKRIEAHGKPYEIKAVQERIQRHTEAIQKYSDDEFRCSEAHRLLEHRSHYIDRLTPRDRAIIDLENIQLQKMIDKHEKTLV